MSSKLYFKNNLISKINSSHRDELHLLKITKETFSDNKELIQQSINTFNSEIEWDDMWTIDIAKERISYGETLYLLLDNQNPLGHVWYDLYYLYNAFVSQKRKDGDSIWFIQETMWDMKQNNDLTYIKLYVDDWNKKAIKFWKKLNFTEE